MKFNHPLQTVSTVFQRLVASAAALLLLAACQSDPQAVPTLTPGFAPQRQDVATLPPPQWSEGAGAITTENASHITNLGRLDASDAPSTVFAFAFSPDGTRLAGLDNDRLLAWNLQTGALIFIHPRNEAVQVFYSIDKTEIYTLTSTGMVAIYDADTGAYKSDLAGQQTFAGVSAYQPDQGWLALGGDDGSVKVWDPLERQSLVTLNAHQESLLSLAFSADGTRLATASRGGEITIWDWKTRTALASMTLKAGTRALRLAFSPDGTQLASATEDELQLWAVADGTLQHALSVGRGGASELLLYSPDGQYLLNSGSIPALMIWNPVSGVFLNTLPGVGGDRTAAAFSPDGGLLVTAVLGKPVSLWDTSSFHSNSLQRADLAVASNSILSLAWTNDGFLIALFDATGSIHLWGIPPQD